MRTGAARMSMRTAQPLRRSAGRALARTSMRDRCRRSARRARPFAARPRLCRQSACRSPRTRFAGGTFRDSPATVYRIPSPAADQVIVAVAQEVDHLHLALGTGNAPEPMKDEPDTRQKSDRAMVTQLGLKPEISASRHCASSLEQSGPRLASNPSTSIARER